MVQTFSSSIELLTKPIPVNIVASCNIKHFTFGIKFTKETCEVNKEQEMVRMFYSCSPFDLAAGWQRSELTPTIVLLIHWFDHEPVSGHYIHYIMPGGCLRCQCCHINTPGPPHAEKLRPHSSHSSHSWCGRTQWSNDVQSEANIPTISNSNQLLPPSSTYAEKWQNIETF